MLQTNIPKNGPVSVDLEDQAAQVTAAPEPLKITFGVEIECVVAYPAGVYFFGDGRKDLKMKSEVEELLDRTGLPTNELRGDDPIMYDKWTIKEDATIKKPANTIMEEYDDLEITSRILCYDDPDSFQEIRNVLDLVRSEFKLIDGIENSCGLHVHIGNEDRGFEFEVLRRYALLVTGFEHLLLKLIPAYRVKPPKGTKCFCIPPSELSELKGLALRECLDKIWACEREWQLQDIMSPIWQGKNLAFNFSSHSDSSKRTIEHRIFPGTTHVEDVLAAVELCATLVSFAWDTSDEELALLLESAFDACFNTEHLLTAIGKAHLWGVFWNINHQRDIKKDPLLTARETSTRSAPGSSSTDVGPLHMDSLGSVRAPVEAHDILRSEQEESEWIDALEDSWKLSACEIDGNECLEAWSEGTEGTEDLQESERDSYLCFSNLEAPSTLQTEIKPRDDSIGEVRIYEDLEGLAAFFTEDLPADPLFIERLQYI